MLAVRVRREADAGVAAARGEDTAERSAHRDGSHADRRYDCTSTHSVSAILGPRTCASSPSYLVLTENPFPCIQMIAPEPFPGDHGRHGTGRVNDISGGGPQSRAKHVRGPGTVITPLRPATVRGDRGEGQGRNSRRRGPGRGPGVRSDVHQPGARGQRRPAERGSPGRSASSSSRSSSGRTREPASTGVGGDGKKIICEDKKDWRWETYRTEPSR